MNLSGGEDSPTAPGSSAGPQPAWPAPPWLLWPPSSQPPAGPPPAPLSSSPPPASWPSPAAPEALRDKDSIEQHIRSEKSIFFSSLALFRTKVFFLESTKPLWVLYNMIFFFSYNPKKREKIRTKASVLHCPAWFLIIFFPHSLTFTSLCFRLINRGGQHSSGNGRPWTANSNDHDSKVIFLLTRCY